MGALGMSAEYVLSATVVLPDGSVVTASPTLHGDLFWALRGGGGGKYGIILDFTIRLLRFPRSAMVMILLGGESSVRYEVAQRFFD
jgi:FAD/FMN-containing dehydrogenase